MVSASDWCQRWDRGTHSWRHRSEGGFDPGRYTVEVLDEVSDEPISQADWDQVRFRMLEPDYELRRAMAFGDHYQLDPGGPKPSTKRQMTAGLGNAVVPPVAEWITMRCMATFGLAA